MSEERKPLWSDDRIEAELRRIGDNMRLYIADAATVAEQVRDAYEARIAELEAQLAQTWQPLPDGEYDMGVENEPLYVFGNTDPDVCTHVEWQGETVMLDLGMTVCRLVNEPRYSHRNGETEPPTIVGWYWFNGDVCGEIVKQKVTVMMYSASGRLLVADVEAASKLDCFEGQWWGPIVEVSPWEVDHE